MNRLTLLSGVLAALALIASLACSGSRDTVSGTGEERELRQLLLQAEDVPEGFRAGAYGFTTSEGTGYTFVYSNFPSPRPRDELVQGEIFNIDSYILRFPSAEGATEYLIPMREKASAPRTIKSDPDLPDFDVRGMVPLDITINGVDEYLALHAIIVPPSGSGARFPMSLTLVAVRKDALIGVVVIVAREEHPETGGVVLLVEKAIARIDTPES